MSYKYTDKKDNFSIIIPIYNEEEILEREILKLIDELNRLKYSKYEILLVENGSVDKTPEIASGFSNQYPQIKVKSLKEADFGKALKAGIFKCRYNDIIAFNVDNIDIKFLTQSLEMLSEYDIVISSKCCKGLLDRRPLNRRIITRVFNLILKLIFSFKGTDSHGAKSLKKDKIINLVKECKTSRGMFDTEVVLRAERENLKICEIPIEVEEKRKTRRSVVIRILRYFIDLITLWKAMK